MKIRDPDLSVTQLNRAHQAAGLPPLDRFVREEQTHPRLVWAVWFTGLMLLGITLYLAIRFMIANGDESGTVLTESLQSETFWVAVAVGFAAQLIDGALGMAYGLSATSFLLSTGASPAVASASVHIAEVFTTGLSGISHIRFGNVRWILFVRLLLPGTLGSLLGVLVVTQLDSEWLRQVIVVYLMIMGIYIFCRAIWGQLVIQQAMRHVGKLAFVGGFVDSSGGGGWGPVVTTSLIGAGHDPRTTIGSVNLAEFFLTLVTAASFSLVITSSPWLTIAGLVAGGLLAAPLAAIVCRFVRPRVLMAGVGGLIVALSLWNLIF
ncbi:COG0730 Predicted permeases [Burkholderiales bacterium]